MNNEKRSFKEEVKNFWEEHGKTIKVGIKCLATGLLVGFIKGVLTESEIHSREVCKLIDKIPYEPDGDDIAEYVHYHIDELKPYIEAEIEYNE